MVEYIDNAITFESWQHPGFLELCARYRDMTGWALGVVSGCFDLFHIGHVNLITQAVDYDPNPDLCIFLVALVNSDSSVAGLKGLHRPYNNLPARLRMIASQMGVQGAAGFNETTPEKALAVLKPKFLFKGEEYRDKPVPEAKHCGQLVFLPETKGYRSTELEQRIIAASR